MKKNSAVTITQQPENCVCTPGGPAWFTVTASGTGLTYRWQYSTDNSVTWINSANETAATPTLYMNAVTDYQLSVIWRCIVTDATGHTAVTQNVGYNNTSVAKAITITNQPDNYYCAIGEPAHFEVAATGTGLTYQWQYSSNNGGTWYNSINGTATTAALYIDSVDEYNMRVLWRCKITDSNGNVTYSRRTGCKRSTTRWQNFYDLDGLRVKRTNRETTYLYTYLGGQLTHMKVDGQNYYFTYSPSGVPIAMTWNGANYYYVTNLQGDVTQILNSSGAVVTSYVYDAWGKIISVTGSLAGTVGRYNPLRYRGYVYDTETGLYYLQSRYYNPEIGRWINADIPETLTVDFENFAQYNLFAYCFNNPVNMSDETGAWPNWVKKAVAVVAVAVVVVAATVVTVATYGAGSVAGVAMITTAATLAAKTTEVAALQVNKGKAEGKSGGQIAKDTFESIYDNGSQIVGLTPITKSSSIAVNHGLDAAVEKGFNGNQTFNQTLASTGGKVVPYAFVAIAWTRTIRSAFSDDPVARAIERGYILK